MEPVARRVLLTDGRRELASSARAEEILLQRRDVGQIVIQPDDAHAVHATREVEVQRLVLAPRILEAGPIGGPRPQLEQVVGVPLLDEEAEPDMGNVRTVRPQVRPQDPGVERIVEGITSSRPSETRRNNQ